MQEKHLYEYAVIRVVPRVDREEFLNVGVVLFCKREKYLKVHYQLVHAKLVMLSSDLDLEQLELNLKSFEKYVWDQKMEDLLLKWTFPPGLDG